ncbi:MAG: hypothetical protein NXI01_04730 [Gammaproteobacteria bacterium]|nr:hypothetical protein [Gammaproteobacteria bacterium]
MKQPKNFHAILMVTGTSIGTGILALPIPTSTAGFLPTILAFIIAWAFMTIAAFYILDVKMHYKGHYNLSSLIKLTLGQFGHYLSSSMILVLLYALLCTYMMACAAWFHLILGSQIPLSQTWLTILFVMLIGLIILLKERVIYSLNHVLAICLGLALAITVGFSLWPIDANLIQHSNFPLIFPSLPILLTTFGFSIVVPTITEYLDYDARAVKSSILIGSLLAFVAYAIWEWVILGHIPLSGTHGLTILNQLGDNGTGVINAFAHVTQHHWIVLSGRLFAIFASLTSFLGVALALVHCLHDLTPIKTQRFRQTYLTILALLPPLIITLLYPKAFVSILSFAGLEVALLLGLFPTLMIAKMRYKNLQQFLSQPTNLGLIITGMFFILVMIQEGYNIFNLA